MYIMISKCAKILPLIYSHELRLHFIILETILFSFIGTNSSLQPPYQVALYVTLHPRVPPVHYCNGIIAHSRLILTTASCTYYQPPRTKKNVTPMLFEPSAISVVPGAAIEYNKLNTFDVVEIIIAQGFNSTTLANNLALLRLDVQLPLSHREDIRWIILDEYANDANGSYMAGFPSLNVDSNTIRLENVRILPNEECAPNMGNGDICGSYSYAVGPDFGFSADFAAFNTDYGTGLILRNDLIALFSQIVFNISNQNCHDKQLKAIYTTVGPNLNWIYEVIAEEELMLGLNSSSFVHAPPYQQRGNNAIKFTSDATGSTTAVTTIPLSTTIES